MTQDIVLLCVPIPISVCKVSPFEFLQKWNSVPPRAGNAAHCHALLLLQVDPPELPRRETSPVYTCCCMHVSC